MKLKKLFFYLSFLLLIALSLRVEAHPHNWITLKTEFTVDKQGRLTRVLQHWAFDIYYSAILLDDLKKGGKSQQQALDYKAKDMVKNLKSYDFFSELIIDEQPISLDKPSEYSLSTSVKEEQQQLILTMGFTLKEPLSIRRQSLSWRVFDPTYYIDMKHHELSEILIHQSVDTACSTHIDQPKPTREMIEYATSLDRSQKDTQGLGSYFAEKVLIHCQ